MTVNSSNYVSEISITVHYASDQRALRVFLYEYDRMFAAETHGMEEQKRHQTFVAKVQLTLLLSVMNYLVN